MYKYRLILTLVVLGLFGCTTNEVFPVATLKEFTDHLDKRIPDLMEEYEIPGLSIALIRQGETVWTNAYGYADLESGRRMTSETYCRVESISKSVTAWGVLRLVQQGKIDLDRPVVNYLKNWDFPESKFSEGHITTRQLLSQSSGLPMGTIGVRYAPMQKRPTLNEILTKDAILSREPGSSFSYSNTGFKVLELLIEEVSGQDFAAYMEEEVMIPLGMNHASFNWSADLKPEIPNGYDLQGNSILVYVYPDKASGGLLATVSDIAHFVTAGMPRYNSIGSNVLDEKYIDSLYAPEVGLSGYYHLVFDSYGFGHFIEYAPNGTKSISHGGQGSGWMTHFQSVPESGDGIVILTNSQRSWPVFGHILNDWALWNGLVSTGMGKILMWTKALWALIALLLLYVGWQAFYLIHGWRSGHLKFVRFAGKSCWLRIIKLFVSSILIFALIWIYGLPYFFMFSVFPKAAIWLIGASFLVALVLALSALFAFVKPVQKQFDD